MLDQRCTKEKHETNWKCYCRVWKRRYSSECWFNYGKEIFFGNEILFGMLFWFSSKFDWFFSWSTQTDNENTEQDILKMFYDQPSLIKIKQLVNNQA